MRTFAVVLLFLVFPRNILAQVVDYSVDISMWSELSEKFTVPGKEKEEFQYRPVPLAFKLGARFGDAWSVEGRMMYAKLYGLNTEGPGSLGDILDLDGSIGWHPIHILRLHAGYTYSKLNRQMNFHNYSLDVVTTEKGPLVGASATSSEDTPLIARGSFDLYPYLNVHDTFHPEADGFRRGNYGFRTEGALGWWFNHHVGLYGTGGYQKISTLEGKDKSFGRHEAIIKNIGLGMAIKF